MIQKTEIVEELVFDANRIALLQEYINTEHTNSRYYGESREVVSEIVQEMEAIISSAERRKTDIQVEADETEEQAREYFGEDFIKQFESLRKKLLEQNTTLFIHGTYEEAADNILVGGLEYKSSALTATAVKQPSADVENEYQNYESLLNWPHLKCKNLVLVGIPNECMGDRKEAQPLWEQIKTKEEQGADTRGYVIRPEFIIGKIDVNKKMMITNPLYSNEHNYEGLILDNDLARDISEKEDIKDREIPEEQEGERIGGQDSSKRTTIEAADVIESLIEYLNEILLHIKDDKKIIENVQGKLPINADWVLMRKEEILEAIDELKKIIPTLKTKEQVDDEVRKKQEEKANIIEDEEAFFEEMGIEEDDGLGWEDDGFLMDLDDTISDETLSDINSVTGALRAPEKEQTKEK